MYICLVITIYNTFLLGIIKNSKTWQQTLIIKVYNYFSYWDESSEYILGNKPKETTLFCSIFFFYWDTIHMQ